MQVVHVDGTFNVRTAHGQKPWLVRSGHLDTLTLAGAETLHELGVTRVVDLRENAEAASAQTIIAGTNLPIYGRPAPDTGRLEDIYEGLLRERGSALAAAVKQIALEDGAVLVHCTAGKDRTGLVVALTLAATGTPREEIVADYVRSARDVRIARGEFANELALTLAESERAGILRLHLESPPEAIEHALDVIDELGGAAAYLENNGLDGDALARLRDKANLVGAL